MSTNQKRKSYNLPQLWLEASILPEQLSLEKGRLWIKWKIHEIEKEQCIHRLWKPGRHAVVECKLEILFVYQMLRANDLPDTDVEYVTIELSNY